MMSRFSTLQVILSGFCACFTTASQGARVLSFLKSVLAGNTTGILADCLSVGYNDYVNFAKSAAIPVCASP